jgi:phosphosulfolactate synthase
MNFKLPFIPERTTKPRESGLTMMMDKGLSVHETENFVASSAVFADLAKFGFGTALITNELKTKISIYKEAGVRPYFGGTLFEAFIIRDMFEEYLKLIDELKLEVAEISDGSMIIPHEEKLKYINILSKQVTVLSEVGYKIAGKIIPPEKWVEMMKTELNAGAWKVIAEARESGTVGIYNKDGSANAGLINEILGHVHPDDVLWEAPDKSQQVWFIKLLGSNVNLGNIPPHEVIALETLRIGMRGDTFFDFLPEGFKERKL